jgi:hypothetical protein
MGLRQIQFRLTGTKPLLMHNIRLADQLDPFAKALAEVTKKRVKTEADHAEISRREFHGAIYADENGPYLPDYAVMKNIVEGGKAEKLGKTMTATINIVETRVPVLYAGPRTVEKLWEAGAYLRVPVGVGPSRTLRTRPKFVEWSIEPTVAFDDSLLDVQALMRAYERSGRLLGLGDYRPQYGLFNVEVISE